MIRLLIRVAASLLLLPIGILVYQEALRAEGNFRTVIPNQLYRSAQLSARSLEQQMRDNGIRTVVNLRGAQPDATWYKDEVRVVAAHGGTLIDFPMSASKRLSPERARQLIATLKDAPKPILVHCRTGADRTGLVSVIYANQVAGMDEKQAEGQLSALYGHFGIPFLSPTYAMDESWEEMEQAFGIEDS